MTDLILAGGASDAEATVTVDLIREEWADNRLDLERDTWVAVDQDGEYVAAVEVWLEEPDSDQEIVTRHIGFTIRPEIREQKPDLMRTLFDRALRHATSYPPRYRDRVYTLRAWAAANDGWKQEWILSYGFEPVHSSYIMVHDGLDRLPAVPGIPGVRLQPWSQAWDRPLWKLVNEGFETDDAYAPLTWEEWRASYHAEPMEPELWRIAVEEETDCVVGVAMTEIDRFPEPPEGWITGLGVIRRWREHGVGLSLLLAALHGLREAGVREVHMAVDNLYSDNDTRLYEAAGFQVMKGSLIYHRPLEFETKPRS